MRRSRYLSQPSLSPLKDTLGDFLQAIALLILTPLLVATLGLLAMVLLAVAFAQALCGQKIKPSSVFRSMSSISLKGW